MSLKIHCTSLECALLYLKVPEDREKIEEPRGNFCLGKVPKLLSQTIVENRSRLLLRSYHRL